MNICIECVHFIRPALRGVWYAVDSYKCNSNPSIHICPVLGKEVIENSTCIKKNADGMCKDYLKKEVS